MAANQEVRFETKQTLFTWFNTLTLLPSLRMTDDLRETQDVDLYTIGILMRWDCWATCVNLRQLSATTRLMKGTESQCISECAALISIIPFRMLATQLCQSAMLHHWRTILKFDSIRQLKVNISHFMWIHSIFISKICIVYNSQKHLTFKLVFFIPCCCVLHIFIQVFLSYLNVHDSFMFNSRLCLTFSCISASTDVFLWELWVSESATLKVETIHSESDSLQPDMRSI